MDVLLFRKFPPQNSWWKLSEAERMKRCMQTHRTAFPMHLLLAHLKTKGNGCGLSKEAPMYVTSPRALLPAFEVTAVDSAVVSVHPEAPWPTLAWEYGQVPFSSLTPPWGCWRHCLSAAKRTLIVIAELALHIFILMCHWLSAVASQ